jgi:hypothetical protein
MKLAPYIKYAITIFFWTLLLYMHTSKVPVKKQEFTYKLKQLDPAEKLIFWISPLGCIIYYLFLNFFKLQKCPSYDYIIKEIETTEYYGQKRKWRK